MVQNRTSRLFFKVLAAGALATVALQAANAAVVQQAVPQSLPSPLSLQQAISLAIANQPQQYIALSQTQQAGALKAGAQALYFPVITPKYQFQQDNVSGGSGGANSFSGGQASIGLTEDLFDNGKREVTNAVARQNVDAAQDSQQNTQQQVVLNVTQDYYNLLRALDLETVSQAEITRAQQEVALIHAEVDAGTAAKTDVYQPQADLAQAQVSLDQNQNLVDTSSASLKNAMGVVSNAPVVPAKLAADGSLPPLPAAGPAQTVDQYVQTAYANRPDLQQQDANVNVQDLSVKQAQLNAGVQVDGSYSLAYNAAGGIAPVGLDSRLDLTVSYPLFDGGADRDAVHAAQAQADVTKDQLEQLRQNIRTQVEQDASTRVSALSQVTLAQASVTSAQVNYDATVAKRQEGLATPVDISTAQVTLTQAQDQYVTAVYTFYNADAALQRDLGVNDPSATTPAQPATTAKPTPLPAAPQPTVSAPPAPAAHAAGNATVAAVPESDTTAAVAGPNAAQAAVTRGN